jgi:hypothetical protein
MTRISIERPKGTTPCWPVRLRGHCATARRLPPHIRHAKSARRVTLPQPSSIAENRKFPHSLRHPASTRGTLRPIVTKREAGCDGCVDCARRAQPMRTAKSRGPDAPTLASSWRKMNPPATEANKPGTPGRAHISRQTIAQGMPDCFGVPVVTCLRAFFPCTQGCGCTRHPAFPAPSSTRGSLFMHHSDAPASRERWRMFFKLFFRIAGLLHLIPQD